MKKSLSLVFILALLCLLSGCSDQEEKEHFVPDIGEFFSSDDRLNSTPDKQDNSSAEMSAEESAELEEDTKPTYSAILKDLQTTFPEYAEKRFRYKLTIDRFEVVLSQTEEKTYSASLTAYASSSYSDYSFSLDVSYLKYDQGWVLDSYKWKDYSYQQVRFPEEDELKRLLYAQRIANVDVSNFTFEENTIKYRDRYTIDWSDYGFGELLTEYTWAYDVNDNTWEYRQHAGAGGEFSLKNAWQGIWKYDGDGYIIISNVTEKTLDLEMQTPYSRNFYGYKARMELDEDSMVATSSEVSIGLALDKELPDSATIKGDLEMRLTLTRSGDVRIYITRSGSNSSTSIYYYDFEISGESSKISDGCDIMEVTDPRVTVIQCVDRFRNPIEGVQVQLCLDDYEIIAEGITQENGIAFFSNVAMNELSAIWLYSCDLGYTFNGGDEFICYTGWPSGAFRTMLYEYGYFEDNNY